ncbi:MAG: GNAT family N-acetyltransferase [Dehalococcoidia bacterium]
MGQKGISVAGHGDVPCVADCLKGFAQWLGSTLGPDERLARDVARLIDDPDTDFFVAYDASGRCAGMLQQRYRFSLWLSGEEATIEDLFVQPWARGQGLGRALVEFALARATERGCRRSVLDVTETNAVPLAMYERMGFTCVRQRPAPGRQLLYVKPLP